MRVVLIHGWNVKDGGENTIDRIATFLVGYGWEVDTDEADYGFLFWTMLSFIGRKVFAKRIIRRLIPAIDKADVIVTHSNGAAFATRAMQMMADKDTCDKIVVHFSPALDCSIEPPHPKIKKMMVAFTNWDWVVKLSSLLPFSIWGNMGSNGYSGKDPRVQNQDHTGIVRGHSDWFKDEKSSRRSAWLVINFVEGEIP